MDVYDNLQSLGVELPEPPPKGGIYSPVRQVERYLYTAGQGAVRDGKPTITGKVGAEVTPEQARRAACDAALNMVAALHRYTGDLNRIESVVKILGFVASDPTFYGQPAVMDGASEFLVRVFGEAGFHARSAIGTNVLPNNMPVEIEGIFLLRDA